MTMQNEDAARLALLETAVRLAAQAYNAVVGGRRRPLHEFHMAYDTHDDGTVSAGVKVSGNGAGMWGVPSDGKIRALHACESAISTYIAQHIAMLKADKTAIERRIELLERANATVQSLMREEQAFYECVKCAQEKS